MSTSYSLRADAFARLRRNRMALAGLLLLAFLTLACLIGPLLSPYSFREQNLANANAPACPTKHQTRGVCRRVVG